MVKLTHLIGRLESRKILVAGDLMLDTYTFGKARRISPEAPVAVVQVLREESRPGGAGNVALNLISLGAQVVLLSRVGSDSSGKVICDALENEGINVSGVFCQKNFETPVKNRVIADNQQIVRVDYEQVMALSENLEEHIIELLPSLMKDIDAIAISDYGKGLLSNKLLAALIEQSKVFKIPVITDPKGTEFSKYKGSDIIKPNLSEAYAAAGCQAGADLDMVARKILEISDAETLMITRSEAGISVFQKNGERLDFPAKSREIKDVTGAGDTVLAVVTYAIANQLPIHVASQLSNIAASIAIEHVGCVRVTLSDLVRRLLDLDLENKVFDEEQLSVLCEILRGRSYSLLGLNSKQGMDSTSFSAIQRLGKNSETDLVVYLTDVDPDEDFINLLNSIRNVRFIIATSKNLSHLCKKVQPLEIFVISNKKFMELSTASLLIELAT